MKANLAMGLVTALMTTMPALAETVAIFPVKLLDTSFEARDQEGEHVKRQEMMAEILASEIGAETLILTPEQVAQTCAPETADCLLQVAREAGADQALFVGIQKVSSLIIEMNVALVKAADGATVQTGELNFRGDNDNSWRRAAEYVSDQIRSGTLRHPG